MLIACPSCRTSYQIDRANLGPNGRSVRCARCQYVWFCQGTEAAELELEPMNAFGAAAAGIGSKGETATDPGAMPASERPPFGPDLIASPVHAAFSANERPPSPPRVDEVAAPLLVPMDESSGDDVESVASRRARRQAEDRRWHWPMPAMSTTILALIALNLGLIAWRAEVVKWLPQTASLYEAIGLPVNLRGLVFANVTSATEMQDGVQVLVVEGLVVSTVGRPVDVPRLRFAVRNAAGSEIYTWTGLPGRNVLTPGETLSFRSRLASPPKETHDVAVRFFNRRDLLAEAP
jgi:predicted Zn finger-like uncharacterized protein